MKKIQCEASKNNIVRESTFGAALVAVVVGRAAEIVDTHARIARVLEAHHAAWRRPGARCNGGNQYGKYEVHLPW